ncbi:MAG: tetratricopeptide repeat protein, partial [Limnospira sp. PMC 1290.21]|uniref:tetratricopeptide repeat protein n=2 Tax=unclassified Limnospira TaxID=2642885 RepID=UPI0028E144E4
MFNQLMRLVRRFRQWFKQLMHLVRRFLQWLTQVGNKLLNLLNPPPPPQRSNPPRLPDHEYEWLFRQLLTKVGQGWNRDQVMGWLRRNEHRVTESQWREWCPRFQHSAKDPEISRQLSLLHKLNCGAISEIAAYLLGETPPETPPEAAPPNPAPTSTDSLPTDAKKWFNDGLQRYDNGDVRGAISSWEKAIEFQPDDHKAWYNRGVALSYSGEYKQAISSYDQALKYKPDLHKAWFSRGNALYHLGEYKQAISSYDQALKY